jgi:phosphatidylglycerophosphate synthase
MRKLPAHLENPVDDFIYKHFIENSHYYFRKCNLTPNMITTASLFFGLLGAYSFYLKKYVYSSVLFILAYILDCMDGYYARLYNMTTPFGDKFDHYSDILKILALLVAMYYTDIKKTVKVSIILILFSALMTIHLGCQQHYYQEDDEEEFLNQMKRVCKNKEWIHKTKYFGCGTFTFVLILCIIFWNKI